MTPWHARQPTDSSHSTDLASPLAQCQPGGAPVPSSILVGTGFSAYLLMLLPDRQNQHTLLACMLLLRRAYHWLDTRSN